MQDPLAGEGFGGYADHETEHGGPAVEAFGGLQLFSVDLGGGGVQEPTLVGLGGTGHGSFATKCKATVTNFPDFLTKPGSCA